jgi:ribonuclease P protein component
VTREPFATHTPSSTRGRALTFPPASRVLRTADFRTAYDHGIRYSGPLFAAFCVARTDAERRSARLGLTVPRAVGGAIVRNRIKRRLREAFRLRRAEIGAQWDIVLNVRRAAALASYPELERALAKVIEKCGP